MIRNALNLSLIMLSAAWAGGSKAAEPPYYWYTYVADSSGTVSGESQIRFDSKGNLKMAYREGYIARYAQLDGHSWKSEIADTSFTAGGSKIGLALDAEDHPHIIYENWSYQWINYAHHDGTDWKYEDIGPLGLDLLDFYELGIDADSKGNVHIVYPASTQAHYSPGLAYIRINKDGSKTDKVFVGGMGLHGKFMGLDLDKDENPVTSYYDFNGVNLAVGYLVDGNWKSQILDSSQVLGQKGHFNSIFALPNGDAVISFQARALNKLMIAEGKPGGEWKFSTVDTVPTPIGTPRSPLAVDPDGKLFIAYPRIQGQGETVDTAKLVLATRVDSTWSYEIVDSSGLAGEYASMALSPKTHLPAIAYLNRSKKWLMVAVARKEAPTDTNNNGILDYREQVSSIRRKATLKAGKSIKPTKLFDASGRGNKRRVERNGVPAGSGKGQILFEKP